MDRLIKKPILTEKSLQEATVGRYSFEVDLKANKYQIARAIKKAFDVDVLEVNTRVLKGRRIRVRGTRLEKEGAKIKKATVKLASGQKISVFETA